MLLLNEFLLLLLFISLLTQSGNFWIHPRVYVCVCVCVYPRIFNLDTRWRLVVSLMDPRSGLDAVTRKTPILCRESNPLTRLFINCIVY
jgi:hypothetical protein